MQVPSFSWLYLGDMTEWEENLLDFKRPSSFSEVSHIEGEKKDMPKYFLPLQYSCLANPMDGGAWWAAVHGVSRSRTWLSDFTFTFHFHALEKDMATHSSVLAWKIPGTGEPGRLLSLGSHRVGHDWSDLAAAAHFQKFLILKEKKKICLLNIF